MPYIIDLQTRPSLLNQIKNDEIALPAIQRDFVWPQEKVLRLLDSAMRGYPLGMVLLWETYLDIQYRRFDRDYRSGDVYTFHVNGQRKRLKLVLDGQQRLQSFYVALYGTLNGKSLYFDVLSGRDSDDLDDEKFRFHFLSPQEAKSRWQSLQNELARPAEQRWKSSHPWFLASVADLFGMDAKATELFKQNVTKQLSLSDEDGLRLSINISTFARQLFQDENLLKVSVVDENLPDENPSRKSEADVLEIFVRINREGTPLSRSDLIFSMLKLNWKESSEALPEFVRRVNVGNSFSLEADFVIRCPYGVSSLGTKFDLDVLRKVTNVKKLRENFQQCCSAIKATVDFVQTQCACANSTLIGGSATMIPFVYYLFNAPKREVRNDQVANAKCAFFLFAFLSPFSRYADSRLGAFIRDALLPLAIKGDPTFPFAKAVRWARHWEGFERFDLDLLQQNVPLTLHIVQRLSGAKVQYSGNRPEVDHIFPRAELQRRGINENAINHVANYWILAQGKNRNKSNQRPAQYFKDVDDSILEEALIDRTLLDYDRYRDFLVERSVGLLTTVRQRTLFPSEEELAAI